MAICSPNIPRNIVRSEAREILQAAFLSPEAQAMMEKLPMMTDAKAIGRIKNDLANMLGSSWDQLERYFLSQGWITKDGNLRYGPFGEKKLAFMAVSTKIVLESKAGGIQQLADSFMAKISAGQDALAEGIQLAKEMRGLARFQALTAGADKEMGWSLRIQEFASADDKDAIRVGRERITVDPVTGEEIDPAIAYRDILTQVAQQLADPEQYQQGINTLIDIAKRVQFADRPQDVVSTAAYYNLPARLFEEIYINGLLSSPATVSVNALSVTWGVGRQILRYGGAKLLEGAAGLLGQTGAAGSAQGFLGSPEQYRQLAAETTAGLVAMQSAVGDAWSLAWRAAKNEREFYKRVRGSGVTESRDQSRAITGVNIREIMANNNWMKPEQFSDGLMDVIDEVGRFVRLPSRAAMLGDQFTKHLVVRAEIAAQAARTAINEGVDLDNSAEYKKILDRELSKAYMYEGDEATQLSAAYEHFSRLTREANAATFQEENSLATSINKVLNKAPFMRPFFPFVRTPLNILRQGFYESTILKPIFEVAGSFGSNAFAPTRAVLEIQQKMLQDPAETARITGQIALSTLLVAAIYNKVQDGTIVGGGPGRWDPQGMSGNNHKNWIKQLSDSGRVPYSIKIGDTSIPFDRLGEPMAIVMRMAADIGMLSSWATQTEQDDMMGAYAGIVASGFYNATFLTGVQQLSEMLNPDKRSNVSLDQRLGKGVQNYMAALTPFGGMLNYLDKSVDPYRHIYGSEGISKIFSAHENAMGRGVFGKVADRVPGIGNTPVLIDQLTGRPIPVMIGNGPQGLNPLQMALPFLPRGYTDADSTWKMAYEISPRYNEKQPGADDVKLTLAEQQQVNAEMAKVIIGGKTVADAVRDFHGRPEVQEYIKAKRGLYTSVRVDIEEDFDAMLSKYFQVALDNVVARNPSMIQRRALGLDNRRRKKMNDPEGVTENIKRIVELMRESG